MDVATLTGLKRNEKIPTVVPGDTVKVHVKVIEGERERIQVFQGVVLKVEHGTTGNFTVRRVAYGTGIERTFPFNSPLIDKVEVVRHGKVRRAKLFYLRGLTTKKARLKEKRVVVKPEIETTEEPIAEATAPPTAAEIAAPEAEAPETTGEAQASEEPEAELAAASPEETAPEATKTEEPVSENETKTE